MGNSDSHLENESKAIAAESIYERNRGLLRNHHQFALHSRSRTNSGGCTPELQSMASLCSLFQLRFTCNSMYIQVHQPTIITIPYTCLNRLNYALLDLQWYTNVRTSIIITTAKTADKRTKAKTHELRLAKRSSSHLQEIC